MDRKFQESFDHWGVPGEWQQELENYLVHGFDPGGFFSCFFANDLYGAAVRSHPANKLEAIRNLSKWIINVGPRRAFGTKEKVTDWLSLSNEQRRKILEDQGLLMTAWDHLKTPV